MNGTLCIRGTPQDYDDWNMPGWSGEEVFGYMKKVREFKMNKSHLKKTNQWIQAENFHGKKWFKDDTKAHGHDGLLDIEPHDPAPITNMILDSMQDQGLGLQPDMFTTGDNPHGCGHVPRTVYKVRWSSFSGAKHC